MLYFLISVVVGHCIFVIYCCALPFASMQKASMPHQLCNVQVLPLLSCHIACIMATQIQFANVSLSVVLYEYLWTLVFLLRVTLYLTSFELAESFLLHSLLRCYMYILVNLVSGRWRPDYQLPVNSYRNFYCRQQSANRVHC